MDIIRIFEGFYVITITQGYTVVSDRQNAYLDTRLQRGAAYWKKL